MIWQECKTCDRFKRGSYPGFSNDNLAQCTTSHDMSPITSIIVEGFSCCPWPGKRIERRTKEQLFMDYVAQMPMLRDPEMRIADHLKRALLHAGYEDHLTFHNGPIC